MPLRWAAAMISSPGSASISLPSIETVTVAFFSSTASDIGEHLLLVGGVAVGRSPLEVGLDLAPEPPHGRRDGRHRRRPERADRRLAGRPGDPRADVVADVEQQVEIARAAVAVDD